jgi:hypothetical protein
VELIDMMIGMELVVELELVEVDSMELVLVVVVELVLEMELVEVDSMELVLELEQVLVMDNMNYQVEA